MKRYLLPLMVLLLAITAAAVPGATPRAARYAFVPDIRDSLRLDSIRARQDSLYQDSLAKAAELERILAKARADTAKAERRRNAADKFGVGLDSVSEIFSENAYMLDPFGDHNRRYVPKAEADPYRRARMKRHFFLGAYTGVEGFMHTRKTSYKTTTPLGAYLGYQIDRISGVRLGGNFALYENSLTRIMMRHASVELDYLLGITRYLYGFSETRWFDVTPLVGVGFDLSRYHHMDHKRGAERRNEFAFKGVFGLNLALNLSSQCIVYAEPYVALAQDQIDLSTGGKNGDPSRPVYDENPMPYDLQWGVRAGIRVDMQPFTKPRFNDPLYNPHLFLDFTAGGTVYAGPTLNARRSLGSDWHVVVGKWLDPIVGIRGGFGANDFYWWGETHHGSFVGEQQVTSGRNEFYRGMSLFGVSDLMLRPMNLSPAWRRRDSMFELDIAAGITVGGYAKSKVPGYGNISRMYWGWTFSADALFRVAPGFSLFIEPRVNLNNYYVPGAYHGKFGHNYDGQFTDKLFTLAAGLRIQRPLAADSVDNRAARRAAGFKRWRVSVQAGSQKTLVASKVQSEYPLNLNAAVRATCLFTPCLGMALEAEYLGQKEQCELPYTITASGVEMKYRGFSTLSYNVMSFKALFVVDVARWWNGEAGSQRWRLDGYIGPSYNLHMHTGASLNKGELEGGDGKMEYHYTDRKGEARPGVAGGFRLGYRCGHDLTVYINPEGHAIVNRCFFTQGNVFTKRLPTFMTKVAVGLEYEF